MLPKIAGAARRGARSFGQFTPGQKAVTLAAIIGIVVGAVFLNRWVTKPTMVPLFSGLATSDASAIVDKLNSAGTPYQLTDGGNTILVPATTVYATRLAMSGAGLPAGSNDSYALVDKQGITTSSKQQDLAIRRSLENELDKTIASIDGVQAAVVHLAVPEKDVFSKETDRSTAAVLVKTAIGKDLTGQQVQSVTNLVSASVPGLKPEDVTISDATGRVLSSSTTGGGSGSADARAQATQEFESRVSGDLQTMLDKVVGPGHAVVQLTADLDFDKTDTTTRSYQGTPTTPPLAQTSNEETWTGSGGSAASGVLGPDNNPAPITTPTPATAAGAAAAANKYSKKSSTVNNALTQVDEKRTSAPGAVKKLSVAVLLDTRTAGTVDVAQVRSLVSSAVGVDAARKDQVQVTRLPFDQGAAKAAAKELADQKKGEAAAAKTGLVKSAALGLLVLAIVVFALLSGRRRKGQGSLSNDERLQIEQLQRTLEIDGARRGELESSGPAMAAIEAAPADPHADLVAMARSEIGELVQAQPAEVAQLLRGWLADRRS